MVRRERLDRAAAEAIGLKALVFLAEDKARLERFLALTGIAVTELSARAHEPEMQSALLEHIAGDESLLLVFAVGAGVRPEDIEPARALLATGGRP